MKKRNCEMSVVQRSYSNSGIIKSETPKINLVKLILHAPHTWFFNIGKWGGLAVADADLFPCSSFVVILNEFCVQSFLRLV